jgi:hypothetical protein
MEVSHLKNSNMIEIQKIEEVKQDIEKSKTMRSYIQNEIEELEEKLKSFDLESKHKEVEFNLKKSEFEGKLKKIKEEIKFESTNGELHEEEFNQVKKIF